MHDDEIKDIIIEQCKGDRTLIKFCEHLFEIESSPESTYNSKYDKLLDTIIKDD